MSESDHDLSGPPRSIVARAAPIFLGSIAIVASAIFLRWIFGIGGPQDATTALWTLPVTMLLSMCATVMLISVISGTTASGEGMAGIGAVWSSGHLLALLGGLVAVGVAFVGGGGYAGIYFTVLAIFAAFDGLILLCAI